MSKIKDCIAVICGDLSMSMVDIRDQMLQRQAMQIHKLEELVKTTWARATEDAFKSITTGAIRRESDEISAAAIRRIRGE